MEPNESWKIADRLQSGTEHDEGIRVGRTGYSVGEPLQAADGSASFEIA
jgi:hypothetical protein